MRDTINLVKIELERLHGKQGLKLFDWMEDNGFFVNRCSTKYHGNYDGGLVDHCINLYDEIVKRSHENTRINITRDDAFIIAFLHDLCKVGAYNKDGTYNKDHPKYHAARSLEIIEQFITLTPFQRNAIKYHMGVYGTSEFSERDCEYYLSDLTKAWQEDDRVWFISSCDNFVTKYKDVKKEKEQ